MVVYPRWRGELNIGNGFAAAASGLSPLARGTPKQRCNTGENARFIPAGAGNTPAPALCPVRRSVYPRWRGEHISRPGELSTRVGLSPLARGTRLNLVNIIYLIWFIPAGAGNTGNRPGGGWLLAGLSPLARGTLIFAVYICIRKRFIPAGAGNTQRRWSDLLALPVYPRWRGEHSRKT